MSCGNVDCVAAAQGDASVSPVCNASAVCTVQIRLDCQAALKHVARTLLLAESETVNILCYSVSGRVLTAHLHIQNAVQYSVNCSTNYVLTTQNQHSVIHLTKMECDLWYCVYMYMFEIKHASQNGQCHVDNSTSCSHQRQLLLVTLFKYSLFLVL